MSGYDSAPEPDVDVVAQGHVTRSAAEEGARPRDGLHLHGLLLPPPDAGRGRLRALAPRGVAGARGLGPRVGAGVRGRRGRRRT